MIAFFPSLGWQEMFLLLVIGLLLYGRNLPDAGRKLGQVVAQLRRSWHDFKDQLDREGELRDVKKVIQDTAREVKNVAKVPRAVRNPGSALRELTHEAMAAPPVDAPEPVDAPPVDGPEPVDEPGHDASDAAHDTADGDAAGPAADATGQQDAAGRPGAGKQP